MRGALVAPLPAGVQVVPRIGASTDLIHIFATRRAQLERALRASLAGMRADATLWVSWPLVVRKAARADWPRRPGRSP